MGFTDQRKAGTLSASFNANAGFGLNTKWSGEIVEVGEDRQATVYGTDGELEFWSKSGKPRMTRPITIQASLNDAPVPVTEEDNGQRAIWFKDGTGLFEALSAAILSHPQAREPEPGDWISVQWVGTDRDTNAKQYVAEWRPGARTGFTKPAAAPKSTPVSDEPPF